MEGINGLLLIVCGLPLAVFCVILWVIGSRVKTVVSHARNITRILHEEDSFQTPLVATPEPQYFCGKGHPMQIGERICKTCASGKKTMYCRICGAERTRVAGPCPSCGKE